MKPESKPSITGHSVETSPEAALNYWTPEKMHNTNATNMPSVDELHKEKPRLRRLARRLRLRRAE